MPTVHVVPVKRGMPHEEVVGRVQGGWTLLGRQSVRTGKSIMTPGNPDGVSVEDADIWLLAEPMIPMAMVASIIARAAQDLKPEDILTGLCQELFGMAPDALFTAMKETANAQEQNPG